MLKEYEPKLKDRVQRALKQWNLILRDYMRNEMALRLTIGEEAQSVPVHIQDGLPKPFRMIVEGFEPEVWRMLLNLPLLDTSNNGLQFVKSHFSFISDWKSFCACPTDINELDNVHKLLSQLVKELKELDVFKRIKNIRTDVLGAYFFRIPSISLYWMVIGLMAGILGVSVEALTIVVTAHELSHAYSHLGRDIDGENWDTENFAGSDIRIVEGLAQFYTSVVCNKLKPRMPAALDAYDKLLKHQSEPYRVHEGWWKSEASEQSEEKKNQISMGEVVRISMIECRSQNEKIYDNFAGIIGKHRSHLKTQIS